MHTPTRDPESYDPLESYAAGKLSRHDMEVAGIVVFVVTMAMFFVVVLVMMLFRKEPDARAFRHGAEAVMASAAASAIAPWYITAPTRSGVS